MSHHRLAYQSHTARLTLLTITAVTPASFAADHAIVVTQGEDGLPEITSVALPLGKSTLQSRGLLVWSDGQQEHWVALPIKQLPVDGHSEPALKKFSMPSRGPDGTAPVVVSSATLQLDQLVGQVLVRGAGLMTPVPGEADLDGRITIRRQPKTTGTVAFPDDEIVLTQHEKPIASVKFAAGVQEIGWDKWELPTALQQRLPAGEYQLRAASGGAPVAFRVESKEVEDWVWEQLARLRSLKQKDDPLFVQVAAEHLLAQRDDQGRPAPYRADALDLLTQLPAGKTTKYLQTLTADLQARIADEPATKSTVAAQDTDPIQGARELLQAGKWSDALDRLAKIEPGKDKRLAGLKTLYRAVILAEHGGVTGDQADSLFAESIQVLAGAEPSERLRAHNNYANFLLNRAQDRVYNHAFQIATGASDPLAMALIDWRNSRDHYQAAFKLAESVDPAAATDIQVNQARLYMLLADLVRTLNSTIGIEQAFTQAETSATDQAAKMANDVLHRKDTLTPRVLGVVHEILAHLAYRAGQADKCRAHADLAMSGYLDAGALTGVESVYRLLGLIALRYSQVESAESRTSALNHFLTSNSLAEFLQRRVPNDRIGLGMAGYFARRAYVNEQIIGLLIAAGRYAEALEFAEAGKARSLQQVLRQHQAGSKTTEPTRTITDVLSDWPEGTVALEYLIGSEHAWVFVIKNGKVTASQIADDDAAPLASRELVTCAQRLLGNMNMAARKMFQQRRFDHDWQAELHGLYNTLIPVDTRTSIKEANTLLIIPHHVLHYFPFAALVTQLDSQPRAALEMPQARFLIDDLGSAAAADRPHTGGLVYAPSLLAWDTLRLGRRAPVTQVNAVGIVDFQSAARLPGVEQDMANLKAAFGKQIHTLVEGSEATEESFAALLHQPGLLFVATHGMNVAEQPLSSFLLCHADARHDGRLTAGEIFLSPLSADVVVMSACYSGLADRSPLPGDDLFGLQRAFLHSGVQSVVSGLWDVYDATGPVLMNDFFKHFSAGQPVADALVAAQRDFLKTQRAEGPANPWTHPYFWAVYTAAGNDQLTFTSN